MAHRFTPEEFVLAWLSGDLADVCRRLGLTPDKASNYACDLRSKGVQLPRKHGSRGRRRADVASLNRIIQRYGREGPPGVA